MTELQAVGFDEHVRSQERKEILGRRQRIRINTLANKKSSINAINIPKDSREALEDKVSVLIQDLEDDRPDAWRKFATPASAIVDDIPGQRGRSRAEEWLTAVLALERSYGKFVGLALSGGGIRSAAFNLGVLQALDNKAVFPYVDYLSTVSGGGYIGTSCIWHMHMGEESGFPFRKYVGQGVEEQKLLASQSANQGNPGNQDLGIEAASVKEEEHSHTAGPGQDERPKDLNKAHQNAGERSAQEAGEPPPPKSPREKAKDRLDHLRRYASYLTPGKGLGYLALVAAVARGIVMNLVILIPILVSTLWVFTWDLHRSNGRSLSPDLVHQAQQTPWVLAALITLIYVGAWRYRRPIPWSDRIALQHIGWQSVLWIALVVAYSLSRPWFIEKLDPHPDLALVWPPLVMLAVFAVGVLADKTDGLGRMGLAFVEVAAWSMVLWFGTLVLAFYPALDSSDFVRGYPVAFLLALVVGFICFLKLLVNFLFYTVLSVTRARMKFHRSRPYSVRNGDLIKFGVLCTLLGSIPLVDNLLSSGGAHALTDLGKKVIGSSTLTGSAATALGWFFRSPVREQQGVVAFLLRLGLILLIASGLILAYHFAVSLHATPSTHVWWFNLAWGLMFLFVINSDINYVSMHRYYRNRLLEAFLLTSGPSNKESGDMFAASDNLRLADINIKKSGAPYQLINANLVTVGSDDDVLRLRRGESFTLSPRYVGSENTKYISTKNRPFRDLDLATAMSVSGAAVDPSTGATRSWALRVVMAWLNVRLGYWLAHPDPEKRWSGWLGRLLQSSWLWLITKEMFGHASEDWRYVRLSDGGHFENLGLYELIRRQCALIIVCDAGADPKYKFADLARAIELVRTDFNVDIDIDIDGIAPTAPTASEGESKTCALGSDRMAERAYTVGTINYGDDLPRGTLIYVKTNLFPGLPEDVLGFARQNPTFPDESTSNQFFTELQYEAYRELGFRAGASTLNELGSQLELHLPGWRSQAVPT